MAAVMLTILAEVLQENPASRPEVRALAGLLFYILILMVVFLFGSYAILRASRRFTQRLSRRRATPTEAGDVWSMHRLPEEIDPEHGAPPQRPDPHGGNGT